MKLVVERHYAKEWTAYDDDTYGGPESPMGTGNTAQEAIAYLFAKMDYTPSPGPWKVGLGDRVQESFSGFDWPKGKPAPEGTIVELAKPGSDHATIIKDDGTLSIVVEWWCKVLTPTPEVC